VSTADADPALVSQAWETHASEWIGWARTPGQDVAFDELNLPALAELVPAAGRRTLDLGCGEGRVGRWLAQRGHRVCGIDSSPTLLAAAREAAGYEELVLGSATALPWPDGVFDAAVAFMSLHDMAEPRAAIDETARVLTPGGVLCLAITHPLTRPPDGDYFAVHRSVDVVRRGGLTMHFDSVNRPLEDYTSALAGAGFLIEQLREPRPSAEAVRRYPGLEQGLRTPYSLHIRARRDR
jgi:SAM-dependent methyltransferase